jgi:hypothetical protein
MFRPGRRLFSIAAVLMILMAAAHTFGILAPAPERDSVLAVNADVRIGFWAFAFLGSITFAALGAINLVIAAVGDDRVIRATSWVNFVWVAAFGVLCFHYWIPPPLILACAIELCVIGGIVL